MFSTSSSFTFRAVSLSDLELLAEVASRLDLAFSDASASALRPELFPAGWSRTDPLAVLLVRELQYEAAWSGSASESSRLWLSSELESCTAGLSVVPLLPLGVGEPGVGLAERTGEGFTGFAVFTAVAEAAFD